jgi:hypothetical protein
VAGVPLVPSPLYGLRTWTVAGTDGDELLAAPQQPVTWPVGGAWIEATCAGAGGHAAPAPGCSCGIHGWHPRRRWARRIFAVRREIPGVVEASGAIEVHEDGFRAQRARPYALMLAPGRNPALVRRLATAYRVPVVETADPQAVLDWCRERGLGLDRSVVAQLIAGVQNGGRASRRRTAGLRIAAALAVIGLLLALGLAATDDPGDRPLYGRTGEIQH